MSRDPTTDAQVTAFLRPVAAEQLHAPTLSLNSPFAWPRRFYERAEISYQWENTAWSGLHRVFDSPQDVITFFLRSEDDSVRYDGLVRPVLDICHEDRPESLDEVASIPQKPVAWLIDGHQSEDGGFIFRPCQGPLTAHQLTSELSKRRYKAISEVDEYDQNNADPCPIDAERRIIYINDLDRWTILALVKTAPSSQSRLLGEFFHKHLCSRASIRVTLESNGPDMFCMAFHLPIRVWRSGSTLLKDERIKQSDRQPLRSSRDVSFLLPATADDSTPVFHGIYSGHIACMVTGYDQWRYTVHFAIDTWFDEDDNINDKVMRYANDMEDGMELDPCSGGLDDARMPIWQPGHWFLRVLSIRLVQIKDEWEYLHHNLRQGVQEKFQRFQSIAFEVRRDPDRVIAEDLRKELGVLVFSLTETRDILQEYCNGLQEIVEIGAAFLTTEAHFFLNNDHNPGNASVCYPHLSNIRGVFYELKQLGISFKGLAAACKDTMKSWEAIKKQQRNLFHSQGLSHTYSIPETAEHTAEILDLRMELLKLSKDIRADELQHEQVMQQLRNDFQRLSNDQVRLQLQNTQLASVRSADIEEVRVLGWNTWISQPFTHTAALFSADGVIAFPKNWITFILSLIFASTVVTVMTVALKLVFRRSGRVVQKDTLSTTSLASNSSADPGHLERSFNDSSLPPGPQAGTKAVNTLRSEQSNPASPSTSDLLPRIPEPVYHLERLDTDGNLIHASPSQKYYRPGIDVRRHSELGIELISQKPLPLARQN